MRVLKRFLLLLMVALTAISSTVPAAHAAEGIDLTTSPLPINLTAGLGSTVTTVIQVKNNSTTTQQIKVSLMKFSAYGDSGQPALKDREPGDDYFDWVSFSPQVLTATPGQWKTTRMTIRVPRDAGFGYYYAVVFTPVGAKPTGKGNVLLGSSAVLVLLEVQNPNAKKQLTIDSFSVNRHIFEFLPATFSVKLHNSGNVHVIPHGDIFIKRGSSQVAALPLNGNQGNILPSTNRIYTSQWKDGFPVYVKQRVNGQASERLNWDFKKASKLKAGHYTAHLLAVYDNGKKDVPLEAKVSFWVIPWRVFLLIIAIPLVPALIVYLIMKRRLRRQLQGEGRRV